MNDDQNHQNQTQNMTDEELAKKVETAEVEAEAKAKASEEGIQDSSAEVDQLKEALARSMADLKNFRRRSEEEKASFVKFANAQLLKSLLPIFDNLNRSVDHLPEALKEDNWAKGVVHVHADLMKTLEGLGIEKMKTVGEALDPNCHEALMSGPGQKDVIIEEFEAGYVMNGEVVKPAKVKVGDGSEKV